MSDSNTLVEQARELGKQIAQHDAAKKLRNAMKKLETDNDARQCLTDYNRHLIQLAQKEQMGQPIEPDEKRKLQSLQTAVVHNLTIRELQMAQMDFADVIRQVDEALTSETGELLPGLGGGGTAGGGAQPAAQSPLVNPDLSM